MLDIGLLRFLSESTCLLLKVPFRLSHSSNSSSSSFDQRTKHSVVCSIDFVMKLTGVRYLTVLSYNVVIYFLFRDLVDELSVHNMYETMYKFH